MSKDRLVFFWLPILSVRCVQRRHMENALRNSCCSKLSNEGETRNAFIFLTSSEKTNFSLIRPLFRIPAYSRENNAQFTPTRSLCKRSKDLYFVPVTLETRGAEPSRTEAHLDHSEEHCVPECAG